jgi:hypothetical protein
MTSAHKCPDCKKWSVYVVARKESEWDVQCSRCEKMGALPAPPGVTAWVEDYELAEQEYAKKYPNERI